MLVDDIERLVGTHETRVSFHFRGPRAYHTGHAFPVFFQTHPIVLESDEAKIFSATTVEPWESGSVSSVFGSAQILKQLSLKSENFGRAWT